MHYYSRRAAGSARSAGDVVLGDTVGRNDEVEHHRVTLDVLTLPQHAPDLCAQSADMGVRYPEFRLLQRGLLFALTID